MQTQYALKQAGLTLPVTKEFQQHITTLLANQVLQKNKLRQWLLISVIRTTVQNPADFIRLKCDSSVRITNGIFDYVTDFSYMGRVYPELEKEIDFAGRGILSSIIWLGNISLAAERNEIWSCGRRNFMEYLSRGLRVTVRCGKLLTRYEQEESGRLCNLLHVACITAWRWCLFFLAVRINKCRTGDL